MAEMKQCRCESTTHDHHPGNRCAKPATEEDGYCKKCHDLAARELNHAKPQGVSGKRDPEGGMF